MTTTETHYERGRSVNYNFPVHLADVFTKEGKQVPRSKAVIREDEDRPIAVVSNQYRLIPHTEVMDASAAFVSQFGHTDDVNYTIGEDGTTLISEHTFRDRKIEVQKDDYVGLRVYVENSYNGKGAARVRVGALRLACLNGMVVPNTMFNLAYRHIGSQQIDWTNAFPQPEAILESFAAAGSAWSKLADREISDAFAVEATEAAIRKGVVAQRVLDQVEGDNHRNTLWDLYNHFTYDITHNSKSKSSYINRVTKLARVDRWMSKLAVRGLEGVS